MILYILKTFTLYTAWASRIIPGTRENEPVSPVFMKEDDKFNFPNQEIKVLLVAGSIEVCGALVIPLNIIPSGSFGTLFEIIGGA